MKRHEGLIFGFRAFPKNSRTKVSFSFSYQIYLEYFGDPTQLCQKTTLPLAL